MTCGYWPLRGLLWMLGLHLCKNIIFKTFNKLKIIQNGHKSANLQGGAPQIGKEGHCTGAYWILVSVFPYLRSICACAGPLSFRAGPLWPVRSPSLPNWGAFLCQLSKNFELNVLKVHQTCIFQANDLCQMRPNGWLGTPTPLIQQINKQMNTFINNYSNIYIFITNSSIREATI